MINYVSVKDVVADDLFYEDIKNAPPPVKKKVDDIVRQMVDGERIPNSLNAHQAFKDELWIGYINRSNQHWRLLFWYDEDKQTIVLYRLLTHTEMDRYLD